jgi:hypothetical protein
MMSKRLAGVAVLSLILIFPVSASMVTFLLVETGLPESIDNPRYTSVWEGGLMASFFDAGHIVTNGPIVRLEKKPPQDLTGPLAPDFYEAVQGGAEYYVLGFFEYKLVDGKAVPVSITLKLYEINSKKLMYEQSFTVGRNLDDEYKAAQNAGSIFTSLLSRE